MLRRPLHSLITALRRPLLLSPLPRQPPVLRQRAHPQCSAPASHRYRCKDSWRLRGVDVFTVRPAILRLAPCHPAACALAACAHLISCLRAGRIGYASLLRALAQPPRARRAADRVRAPLVAPRADDELRKRLLRRRPSRAGRYGRRARCRDSSALGSARGWPPRVQSQARGAGAAPARLRSNLRTLSGWALARSSVRWRWRLRGGGASAVAAPRRVQLDRYRARHQGTASLRVACCMYGEQPVACTVPARSFNLVQSRLYLTINQSHSSFSVRISKKKFRS